MAESQTLVDFLIGLLRDGGLRAEFSADPAAALARHGITDAGPRTIYEALVQIGDDHELARRGPGGGDVLNIPPPPPPAYFPGQPEDGAGARYLDNYVSGLDDHLGPFTGSSDGVEQAYDHGLDGTDHDADHSSDHSDTGIGDPHLDAGYSADQGDYSADA
jgi:hypothetical protein